MQHTSEIVKFNSFFFPPTDYLKPDDHTVLTQEIPMQDSSFILYVAIGVVFAILLVTLIAMSYYFCPKYNLCRPQSTR